MIVVETLVGLSAHAGKVLPPSDWVVISQELIRDFAAVTGDDNWYHLDEARAALELPGGRTIAHGLLTLSLVPGLSRQIFQVTNHGRALNYGYDRLRFPAVVTRDSRVRLHMRVISAKPERGGVLIRRTFTMELEDSDRPALVADALTLAY